MCKKTEAHETKWSKKKIIKIILIATAIAITLWFLVCWWEDMRAPDTSMDAYLIHKGSGLTVEDPYMIFPSKETAMQAEKREYYYEYDHSILFLFDDGMVTYLKCTYTEQQFQQEVRRLEQICGPVDYDACNLPSYVPWNYCKAPFKTYALLNEDHHEIIYVAYQTLVLFQESFPNLPDPILTQ